MPNGAWTGPAAAATAAAAAKAARKAARPFAGERCAFCHEGEDSDDPDDDLLMPINTEGEAAVRARGGGVVPDAWQDENMEWVNLGKSLNRGHRLKCAVCGEGDAPLGCKRVACRKNWHVPCAMEPTTGLVIWEDEHCVACPVCAEVLERRARKKAREAEEKAARKRLAEQKRKASAPPAAVPKPAAAPKAAAAAALAPRARGRASSCTGRAG